MDAKLKKIAVTPAVIDEDGDIKKDECATLTFDVPLDSMSQRETVKGLFDVLSQEFVSLIVENKQLPLDGVAGKSVSLTAEDADKQLQTVKGITELA